MDAPTCGICAAPTPDGAVLCTACLALAVSHLRLLPELARELDVTLARQARIQDDRPASTTVRTRDDVADTLRPSPLPYDPAASDLAWALRNTLGTWARVVLDEVAGVPALGVGTAEVAAWLAATGRWWRLHPWAAELAEDVRALTRAVQRAVDRRPPSWYAGPCGALYGDSAACERHLYAVAADAEVICPGCGAVHDAAQRRRWLLALAEDELVPLTQLAGVLSALALPVSVDQVRGWARHGRMAPVATSAAGRALFRLGDALEVLAEVAAAPRRKRAPVAVVGA